MSALKEIRKAGGRILIGGEVLTGRNYPAVFTSLPASSKPEMTGRSFNAKRSGPSFI
jgi:hypothetical protein